MACHVTGYQRINPGQVDAFGMGAVDEARQFPGKRKGLGDIVDIGTRHNKRCQDKLPLKRVWMLVSEEPEE